MRRVLAVGLAGVVALSGCAYMVTGKYENRVPEDEHRQMLTRYKVDMQEVSKDFEEVSNLAQKRVKQLKTVNYTYPLSAAVPFVGPIVWFAYAGTVKHNMQKDAEERRTVRIRTLYEDSSVKLDRCVFKRVVSQSPEIERVIVDKVGVGEAQSVSGLKLDEKEKEQVLRIHYLKQRMLHEGELYGTHAAIMEISKDGKPIKAVLATGTFGVGLPLVYGEAFKELATACKKKEEVGGE